MVGWTVRLLLSQQGGEGPSLRSVLLDDAATISCNNTVASKYPLVVIVGACTTDVSIFKPLVGSGLDNSGARAPRAPRRALLTIVH